MDNLNLTDTQDSEPINLLESTKSVVVNPESVKEKTDRALVANPNLDSEVVSYQYANGEDKEIDNTVGLQSYEQDLEDKKTLITDLMNTDMGSAQSAVQSMVVPDFNQFTNNAVVKKYSKTLTNTVASNTFVYDWVNDDDPKKVDEVNTVLDVTESYVQASSHIRDRVLKEQELWGQKSFVGKAGSFMWGMIPLVDTYATFDAMEDAPTSSYLKGNNIEEQARWLWLQNPDDIPDLLDQAIEEVRAWGGDLAALNYANAFLAYSSSDKFADNLFGGIDVVTAVPVTKIGSALVKGVTRFGTKTKTVMSSIGDVENAAVAIATDNKTLVKGIQTVDQMDELVPGAKNVMSILGKTDTTANNASRKLLDSALYRAELAKRIINEGQVIDNLSAEEVASLAKKEFEDIKSLYTKTSDSFIDYDVRRAEFTPDNTDRIVFKIGKTDGTGFASEKSAQTWAKRHLMFKEPTAIEQQGQSWFIKVEKPIKSVDELDAVKLSSDQTTPEGSRWLKSLYSDGYVSSLQIIKDKRTISDVSELTGELMEQIAKPIGNIGSKKRFNEFSDALEGAVITPKNGKKRWMTLDEFDGWFRQIHNKPMTEAQKDAYVAYRQISDLDYSLRDFTAMKFKQRMGVENWEIKGLDKFEGIHTKELPWNSGDYFRVIAVDSNGKKVLKASSNSGQKTRDKIQDLIDNNYTLIRTFDSGIEIGDDVANYVLAPVAKREGLKFGQSVGYNPGGHLITKSPWFIKQGNIRVTDTGRRLYLGDKTTWGVYSRKQGTEIVEKLEELRQIKKSGDSKAFAQYLADNFPEMTKKDIARIDWDVPFMVTEAGRRVNYQKGVHYDEALVGNSPMSRMNGRFLGERDDQVVDAIYSERKSGIRIEPAKTVNPVQALGIGMKDAFNQHMQTEFIGKSVDNILREFQPYWGAGINTSEVRRNPIAFLQNPSYVDNIDPRVKATIQRTINALNDFLQTPSTGFESVQRAKESIVDYALGTFGPNSKITDILDEKLLHKASNPASFFRGVAFHTKMGLFNPKQMFLQAQIATQVASIGGLGQAMKSVPAVAYSRALWLNNSPQMLEDAAKRMVKFGWKKDEFLESHTALSKSGWDIIGSSNAYRDYYSGPELVTDSTWGKIKSAGLLPFQAGEKFGRVIAWHTSYLNWRKANPSAVLDRSAIEAIRLRASDMTANMTRDMNAQWQRGWLSVPTQFWGFQARVAEQMLSPTSRLTKAERLRLFGGISTMYGIPVGIGAIAPIWPWSDEVKKYMIESGISDQVEQSKFQEFLRDGLLATALEFTTGSDFDTTPYGPAGLPALKELVSGEADWYEMFGGASAGIIVQGMMDAGPAFKGMYYSMFGGDDEENPFRLNSADIADILKPVASVSNAVKVWRAINTGKWITSNETVLGDIGPIEAAMSGLTGLNLESINDSFLTMEASKEIEAEINDAKKSIQKHASRARRALEDDDIDAYEQHIRRAHAEAEVRGINYRDAASAIRRGLQPKDFSDAMIERLQKLQTRKR